MYCKNGMETSVTSTPKERRRRAVSSTAFVTAGSAPSSISFKIAARFPATGSRKEPAVSKRPRLVSSRQSLAEMLSSSSAVSSAQSAMGPTWSKLEA